MTDSILTSVKKSLGIAEEYEVFDPDIIMHTNTALAILSQIGIGPHDGMYIEDKTANWSDFIGFHPKFKPAQSYVFIKVRLLFDPPSTSYLITAFEKNAEEFLTRLSITREDADWVAPVPADLEEVEVLDGGSP